MTTLDHSGMRVGVDSGSFFVPWPGEVLAGAFALGDPVTLQRRVESQGLLTEEIEGPRSLLVRWSSADPGALQRVRLPDLDRVGFERYCAARSACGTSKSELVIRQGEAEVRIAPSSEATAGPWTLRLVAAVETCVYDEQLAEFTILGLRSRP